MFEPPPRELNKTPIERQLTDKSAIAESPFKAPFLFQVSRSTVIVPPLL